MTKGTIVLTPFPFTDLFTIKRRPAVIVSSSEKTEINFRSMIFLNKLTPFILHFVNLEQFLCYLLSKGRQ